MSHHNPLTASSVGIYGSSVSADVKFIIKNSPYFLSVVTGVTKELFLVLIMLCNGLSMAENEGTFLYSNY